MAIKQNPVYVSRIASGDLSASQNRVVVPASTAGWVEVATAGTDIAVGILSNDPNAAGKAARIQVAGVTKMVSSTSVGWTDGVSVSYDTVGDAVPTVVDNALIVGHFFTLDNGQTTTIAVGQAISVQLISGLPLRN